jgi:hypothetical protein
MGGAQRMTPKLSRWQRIVEPIAEALPQNAVRAGRIFTLMEFAVLSKWRGSGIGQALHDRLLAERHDPRRTPGFVVLVYRGCPARSQST